MLNKNNKLMLLLLAYNGENFEDIDKFLNKECKKIVRNLTKVK